MTLERPGAIIVILSGCALGSLRTPERAATSLTGACVRRGGEP